MRAHLSVTRTGDLVYDPSLPHFTPEQDEWREHHFGLAVPEHHFASSVKAMQNVADGFDVSSYQPAGPNFSVNGRRVAAFKATEGTGYFDPHFNANRTTAHNDPNIAVVILYHFARPASHSGGDEARYMLSKIGARLPNEVIALDYEVSPWSVPFMQDFFHVATAAGWPTEFYTYLGMLSANSTAGIPDTGCGLWVAAYGTREPGSDRWPQKDGHQHTDGSPSVPGNDGPWDCSHWDMVALTARAGGHTPPPQPPAPPTHHQEDDMPTVRIPEPGPDSPTTPDGRSYEKGTVATVPGTKGLVQVSADGWPAAAPTVRVAIGSGRPDSQFRHAHPDAGIHDNVQVANWPANWGYDHSTPFGQGFDEQATVHNYGPGDVTLTSVAG